jgi:lipopolysaccharide export system permease protein
LVGFLARHKNTPVRYKTQIASLYSKKAVILFPKITNVKNHLIFSMKTIDRLLIRSFIPPFIVTFFIALFVLMMQTLWLYIDDIIGKGAGILIIAELVFYLSVSLFPLALPIGVLISSVMLLGNLAEQYELSSLKSAGVSLWRVMMPLVLVAFFIGGFSFVCSNTLIPIANKKFFSRLFDIRRQKPTLSLEEGIFNDDFQGFVIRIGERGTDEKTIKNVLMYDHSGGGEILNETSAKTGEMYTTPDKQYMVMRLHEGNKYQELRNAKSKFPFIRIKFREWNKVFDLGQFSINRTDESLFKGDRRMMSVLQLRRELDTLTMQEVRKIDNVSYGIAPYYSFFRDELPSPARVAIAMAAKSDSSSAKKKLPIIAALPKPKKTNDTLKIDGVNQVLTKKLPEYPSLFATFDGSIYKKQELYGKTEVVVRNVLSQVEAANNSLDAFKRQKIRFIYEINLKFSYAAACLIFLFVGAPMGAIVRKGGFGYPMLIAIGFFILFITLTIGSRRLAEGQVMSPPLAAWLPCIVLMPIGFWLTYLAMNDRSFKNNDRLAALVRWVQKMYDKYIEKLPSSSSPS